MIDYPHIDLPRKEFGTYSGAGDLSDSASQILLNEFFNSQVANITLKVWNGSSWIDGELKIWDGSNWSIANIKRYSSGAWF